MKPHTCKCGARWGGSNTAHCPSCHLTFSTVSHFDKHLRKGLEGLVLDEARGVYKSADKRPDHLSKNHGVDQDAEPVSATH